MIDGINFITDEKGQVQGVLLDLQVFRKKKVSATSVLAELSDLQELIDQAVESKKSVGGWEDAKAKLKKLKI